MKISRKPAGLLYAALILLSCSSCLTNKVIGKARYDRKNDKLIAVRGGGVDSEGNLIVNFDAKMDGAGRKMAPYHICVPVDSLVVLFQRDKSLGYEADSVVEARYRVHRIYRVLDSRDTALGTCIEMDRSVVVPGYYGGEAGSGVIVDYSGKAGFESRPHHDSNYEHRFHAVHPVFAYFFDRSASEVYNTPFKNDYIAISIEASTRRRYGRYAWLPVSVVGDVVTLPAQLLGLAFLGAMASVMKF